MKTATIKAATVEMTRDEAAVLLSAVSIALDANGGEAPASVEGALFEIVERLNAAFDFGIGECKPPAKRKAQK
jgi:hypothetical protein